MSHFRVFRPLLALSLIAGCVPPPASPGYYPQPLPPPDPVAQPTPQPVPPPPPPVINPPPVPQPVPPPAPIEARWDNRGWTLLGNATLDGRRDRNTINVRGGNVDQLTLAVHDSNLDLFALTVIYANGERFTPTVRHGFVEGHRTLTIALPNTGRTIARVELNYGNVAYGQARVEVWGKASQTPPPPGPIQPVWDNRGWTFLGDATVDRRRDRDVITVGKYQGRFDQLTMVVADSDLVLNDLVIVFANGERFSPRVRERFGQGRRTRVIDLPGDNRQIARIELAYANTAGGGRAKVEMWGRDTGKPAPTPPPPPTPVFDAKGWTLLGKGQVTRARERDTVRIGSYRGRFDQLTLVAVTSDIELGDVTVTFANGETFSPNVKTQVKAGQRTRVIDLPGDDRQIASVTLTYRTNMDGGSGAVEIYGRDTGKPKPTPAPVFDAKGWTLLGATTVDRARDRDLIRVGNYQGRFDQLTMVVQDSELELEDFIVVFANGERFEPKLRTHFKEGQRSRAIDLPGDDRQIASIELAYRNTAGGGRASVQIYGKDTGKPKPPGPKPAPIFDSKGWKSIGRVTVTGARDRDVLTVGKAAGKFGVLTFAVQGGDVEVFDIVVRLGNGEVFSPTTRLDFRAGTRARELDIPGKLRNIETIEFRTGNRAGDAATIEVFGKATPGKTE